MSHLAEVFAQEAARQGDATALIDGAGAPMSFTNLSTWADRFAGHLQARGVDKGDRLLVAMGVSPALYATLAGLWRVGAVAVFPEPALGLAGLRHAVKTARPTGFVAAGAYRWLSLLPALWGTARFTPFSEGPAPSPVAVGPDDPALISFTSGTTGAPKGIERSQGFLMAQRAAVGPLLESEAEETDLVAFPVFTLINLAAGRTSVLPNWKLSRQGQVTGHDLASWITQTGATRALLPPALAEALTQVDRPAKLHRVFTGGGPVFPDVIQGLTAKGLDCVAVYGSTEAEPIAHLHAPDITPEDFARMSEGAGLLAGPPVPEVDLRLEDGEIWVAGDHVNKGYLDPTRDAEAKVRDASGTIWHRTGDAGHLDEDGKLWLLGRTGSVVKSAHGPLYPFAIETAARTWPGVTRAALAQVGDRPILAIEGSAEHLPAWQNAAQTLGIDQVQPIDQMPLDKRHNSKIDMQALTQKLR